MTGEGSESSEATVRRSLTVLRNEVTELSGTEVDRLWSGGRGVRKRRNVAAGVGIAAVALLAVPLATQLGPEDPLSPAGPATQTEATQTTSTPSSALPSTYPDDGETYDHEYALAELAAAEIQAEIENLPGMVGVNVTADYGIELVWSGPVPPQALETARHIAGDRSVVVDETAPIGSNELQAVIADIDRDLLANYGIIVIIPNPIEGEITVRALPDSVLHIDADPKKALGIEANISVTVEVIPADEVPSQELPPATSE